MATGSLGVFLVQNYSVDDGCFLGSLAVWIAVNCIISVKDCFCV